MTLQLSILIIVILFNFTLGLVIFFRSYKDIVARFFFFLILSIIVWILSNFFLDIIRDKTIAWIITKIAYLAAILITTLFLYFVTIFPRGISKLSKKIKPMIFIGGFLFGILSVSNLIVKDIEILSIGINIISGPLYLLFMIYFLGFMTAGLAILVRKMYQEIGIERAQIQYLLTGIILFTIGGSLTNLIIPYFTKDFSIATYGPFFSVFFVGFTAYSIFKHGLFNIKVIVTETLVFAVWVMILVEVLLAETLRERVLEIGLLVFVIVFGILIIRSVLKEVSQKEKFKNLSEELEKLNFQLKTKTTYLTALQDFTADITGSLDFKTIIQKIVDEITIRLGYVAALLILVSPDNKRGYLAAISSNKATRIGLRFLPKPATEYYADMEKEDERNFSVEAIKSGFIKFSDKLSDFLSPPVPKAVIDLIQKTIGFKSVIGVPIKSENKIIGVIEIILHKSKEEIGQDELEVMQALANQVGIVLKNSSLYEQLEQTNQKLIEMDKMKAGMFSFVSHQIKAPISIVKGFTQLILDGSYGKIPKKVKDTVSLMKDSTDRLIRLVNDFLDLRKIEEGKIEYEFKEVDVVKLAKSVFEELKLLAAEKGLEFSFTCKEKEIKIGADEQRLRQVFQNLIENSIKYTEKGFVKVGLALENMGANKILFSVSDSGLGLKKEVIPELFEQFKRAKEARNIQGSGLGLYLAKEIVKAHKGEIWAESEGEGKGSRFYVRLKTE